MFGKINTFFDAIQDILWELTALRLRDESKVRQAELPQKECSECFSLIDERARRCPYCTTVLIA